MSFLPSPDFRFVKDGELHRVWGETLYRWSEGKWVAVASASGLTPVPSQLLQIRLL